MTELKGKIGNSLVILENVNNSQQLIELDKRIGKGIDYLNNIINHPDIIDISKTVHPSTEYKFFARVYDRVTETEPVLGCKTCLNKFKSTEGIQSMFSNHNVIQLEINNNKLGKPPIFGNQTIQL